MTPTITIPATALTLLRKEGYIARYQHHLGTGISCRMAWEATEAELWQYFRIQRYSTHESFKATLTKWQQTITKKP